MKEISDFRFQIGSNVRRTLVCRALNRARCFHEVLAPAARQTKVRRTSEPILNLKSEIEPEGALWKH